MIKIQRNYNTYVKEKKKQKKYLPTAAAFGQFDCVLSLLFEVVSGVSSSAVSELWDRPASWTLRLVAF